MVSEVQGRRDDIHHATRDEEYGRLIRAEEEFWDRPHIYSLDAEIPVIDRFTNERFTGDEKISWVETIRTYGAFRRGCALGTGVLREWLPLLEQNPSLHVTLYDISGESLAKRERELCQRFPGRVSTQQADLNFAELPSEAYDLILSTYCVHHLLNVEHLAFQINRSLTPRGYFFLYDHVGEARLQFVEGKRRLLEALIEEVRPRFSILRSCRFVWPDLSDWEHSPLEAVRSNETLDIFRHYMREEFVRQGSTLLWLLLWLRPEEDRAGASHRSLLGRVARRLGRAGGDGPADVREVIQQVGPELAPIDRAVTRAGLFLPWDAFAVYRKRP